MSHNNHYPSYHNGGGFPPPPPSFRGGAPTPPPKHQLSPPPPPGQSFPPPPPAAHHPQNPIASAPTSSFHPPASALPPPQNSAGTHIYQTRNAAPLPPSFQQQPPQPPPPSFQQQQQQPSPSFMASHTQPPPFHPPPPLQQQQQTQHQQYPMSNTTTMPQSTPASPFLPGGVGTQMNRPLQASSLPMQPASAGVSLPPPPPPSSRPVPPPPPPATTKTSTSSSFRSSPYMMPLGGVGGPPPSPARPPPPGYPTSGLRSHAPPPPPPLSTTTASHPNAINNNTTTNANGNRNSSSSSIDPSQLPRVPVFTRPQNERLPIYTPKAAMMQSSPVNPPPTDSRFVVQDDGNASPELIRSTLYRIPLDRRVWHQTGDLPMGIVCTPLTVHSSSNPQQPRPRRTLTSSTNNDNNNNSTLVEEEESWTEFGGGIPLVSRNELEDNGSTSLPFPPRCVHCAAYVNPYFGAKDGLCNFCHSRNPALKNYCHNDQLLNNNNVAGNNTAGTAMVFGTVEYAVSGPYVTRNRPVEPIHLYALDLTCPSPHIPAYLAMLEQLGQDLYQHAARQEQEQQQTLQQQQPPKTPPPHRIGLCLFCSAGIFVRQTSITTADHPGRYVLMPDVTQDPFAPLPIEEWTFSMSSSSGNNNDAVETWKLFLDELSSDLESLRKQAQQRNAFGLDGLELSCGGAAAQFLASALADTGGMGTVWTWRRPNFGVGAIPHREQVYNKNKGGTVQNTYRTCTPLQFQSSLPVNEQTAVEFYQRLGTECSKNRVAIDFVMHTSFAVEPPFLDLATLGEFCNQTCGHVIWANGPNWQDQLYQELTRRVQSVKATDAVFKLRCSTGLQVKSFYAGSGTVVDGGGLGAAPELELAQVSPSTCIAMQLDHRVGGIPKDSTFCYVQSALLYTTASGSRRVRVSTLALRTTTVVDEVFQSVDFGTTMTLLLRETVARTLKVQPNAATDQERELVRVNAMDAVRQECVLRMANYRQYGNEAVRRTPLSQLVLPEQLQLYPLFCMGLFKSPLLRPGMAGWYGESATSTQPVLSPSADERAFFRWHAARCHPAMTLTLAHPMLYQVPLDNDDNREGVGDWQMPEDGSYGITGFVRMPPSEIVSRASMADDGIYLLDTGLRVYAVVGKEAPDQYQPQHGGGWESLVAAAPRLGRMVWQLRAFSSAQRGPESELLRPTYLPTFHVSFQKSPPGKRENEVLHLMVDDAICGEKNLSDFLIHLHQKIRERLSQVKK